MIPDAAFEHGISAFDLDDEDMPALTNVRLVRSFCSSLGGGKDCDGEPIMPAVAYIINGEEVGRGNDGEPLVSDARVIERRDYDPEKMLQFAISAMKGNFKNAKYEGRKEGSRGLLDSFVDKKVNRKTGEEKHFWEPTEGDGWVRIQYMEYRLAGWAFCDPVGDFCAE